MPELCDETVRDAIWDNPLPNLVDSSFPAREVDGMIPPAQREPPSLSLNSLPVLFCARSSACDGEEISQPQVVAASAHAAALSTITPPLGHFLSCTAEMVRSSFDRGSREEGGSKIDRTSCFVGWSIIHRERTIRQTDPGRVSTNDLFEKCSHPIADYDSNQISFSSLVEVQI